MSTYKKPTDYFDAELARLLSEKIEKIYKPFDSNSFIRSVDAKYKQMALKERVELMADQLHQHLPGDYNGSMDILLQILGPENKKETGMFTEFYWLMPVAKFVEKYGLNHYEISIKAIEEITKRNTEEYAIRPYIRKYPSQTIKIMHDWALSDNFHLRRLASEGLRPKLPWATKLDLVIDEPEPVFEILTILKGDPIRFVQKSVANHITDYLKVNREAAIELLKSWRPIENEHTQWIVKRATRKHKIDF